MYLVVLKEDLGSIEHPVRKLR